LAENAGIGNKRQVVEKQMGTNWAPPYRYTNITTDTARKAAEALAALEKV